MQLHRRLLFHDKINEVIDEVLGDNEIVKSWYFYRGIYYLLEELEVSIYSHPVLSHFSLSTLQIIHQKGNNLLFILLRFCFIAYYQQSFEIDACKISNFWLVMEQKVKSPFEIGENIFFKDAKVDQMSILIKNVN